MRIAVLGATGRTGRHVVRQALERRNDVVAVARRPDAVDIRHDRLMVAAADALDAEQVSTAVARSDAVVSALGVGSSRAPTVVYSQGVANVLSAMAAASISRIVVVSALPVGPREGQPFLQRRLVLPLLDRLFGATYEDMRRMEARLGDSESDWVVLRPPRLVDRPATGHYRLSTDGPLPGARRIACADLATALLDALGREDLWRRPAVVAD